MQRPANGAITHHHGAPSGSADSVPLTPPDERRSEKSKRKRHQSTGTTTTARCVQLPPPLALCAESPPRAPFCVGAFRHFLRNLPPTAIVDLADEPPIVVMDSARLRASYVMFTRGSTVVARLLKRLGIAGPFDHLPAMPVRASAPPNHGTQAPATVGARLCHPKRARVTSQCTSRPLPTIYDLCCETILDQARAAYRTGGPAAAVNAVADVSSVLALGAPVDVALYACGATLVTRDVALGMLALGESRSDIDVAYACVAWTVLPHGSVGVYERRS
ncbi:hypothetical protein pqer_cds_1074 [Pandoravirus quercus]|uniref:Uncharacterized protein n=1 Tax=Pandoravirus quercus TaxID=2107709 RepID=A0A2U7UAP8_9VIRU|nr:hypothetical protein pqer_cds_1074 [Pandoravirus quercus]AVK75496.1 hypothetical protein pqer_cds_1074 [Pandoravirus quercus]